MKHLLLSVIAATMLCGTAQAQNRVKNIYASTTSLDVELLKDVNQTVQLNRYLYAGYNTLCLPMTLSAEQLQQSAKDLKVERLAAIGQEGSVLNLYFVDCTTEGIQAGMPYLVYSPTSQYFRARNTQSMGVSTELRSVRLSDGEGNQVTFGSGWQDIRKEGRYGIPAKQNVTPLESVLIKTDGVKNFLPTRCGFMWDRQSDAAQELVIKHVSDMNEVTAIVGVQQTRQSESCYDMNGRKVIGQAQKGIFVVGREKILK